MKKLLVGLAVIAIAGSFIALLSIRNRTRNPTQAEDFAHLQKPAMLAGRRTQKIAISHQHGWETIVRYSFFQPDNPRNQ